jgi:hypothetical protein
MRTWLIYIKFIKISNSNLQLSGTRLSYHRLGPAPSARVAIEIFYLVGGYYCNVRARGRQYVRRHPEAPGHSQLVQDAAAPTYGQLEVPSEDPLFTEIEIDGGEATQLPASSESLASRVNGDDWRRGGHLPSTNCDTCNLLNLTTICCTAKHACVRLHCCTNLSRAPLR